MDSDQHWTTRKDSFRSVSIEASLPEFGLYVGRNVWRSTPVIVYSTGVGSVGMLPLIENLPHEIRGISLSGTYRV